MSKRLTTKEVPHLDGWMTIPDAAKILNLSRQYVHRLAASGSFTSLHRIGSTFIVSSWEVEDLTGKYERVDNEESIS